MLFVNLKETSVFHMGTGHKDQKRLTLRYIKSADSHEMVWSRIKMYYIQIKVAISYKELNFLLEKLGITCYASWPGINGSLILS